MFEMPPRFPQNVVLLPFHVAKVAIRIFKVAAERAGIRINSLMIDGSRERVICNRRKGMISEESSFKIPSPQHINSTSFYVSRLILHKETKQRNTCL